jgi:cell division protein FtsZ
LKGARGVLVNITGGPSMSIGEFEEVGNTVKEYAADNATVVVGTVIDPSLENELRVTVVATGLGQSEAKTPVNLVQTFPQSAEIEEPVDYSVLDKPTIIRHSSPRERRAVGSDTNMDYLDVPAFLRRQAD